MINVSETITAFEGGWFAGGKLTFTSGDNQGQSFDVRSHFKEGSIVKIELWQAAPQPIAAGDQFTLLAGCDKTFVTCRRKFANHKNFQGFPHIPGNDLVQYYPRSR